MAAGAAAAGLAVARSKTGRKIVVGLVVMFMAVMLAPVALVAVAVAAVIGVADPTSDNAPYEPPGQPEHEASEAWAAACSAPLVDGAYLRATIYVETGWNPTQARQGRYGLSNTTEQEWVDGVIALGGNPKFTEISTGPGYAWSRAADPAEATGPMHVAVLAELICQTAATLTSSQASDRAALATVMAHRGMDPSNAELPGTGDEEADYVTAVLGAWDAQQEHGTAADGELPDQDAYAAGLGADIVASARKQLGLPYVWGGGNSSGPTGGGFDCSGLTQYAVYTATGGKVTLSRTAMAQGGEQSQVYLGPAGGLDLADVAAGDLIAFKMKGNNRRGSGDTAYTHVGIYAGQGLMIHAPRPGKKVEVVKVAEYWLNPANAQNITVRRISL
ncbi:C40 family peptidase [Sanguibacter sp. A246]|uniref:C40 family peptidase n=1 Tax=Sanguibacter sp. A246 TaxID=3457326 RepID=UPI003FD8ECF4